MCIDRNQLPQHAISTYGIFSHHSTILYIITIRHAVSLPLDTSVEYINQYIVRAKVVDVDPKKLSTVKSLPFLKQLDLQQSPLSVSFIPDPVG